MPSPDTSTQNGVADGNGLGAKHLRLDLNGMQDGLHNSSTAVGQSPAKAAQHAAWMDEGTEGPGAADDNRASTAQG